MYTTPPPLRPQEITPACWEMSMGILSDTLDADLDSTVEAVLECLEDNLTSTEVPDESIEAEEGLPSSEDDHEGSRAIARLLYGEVATDYLTRSLLCFFDPNDRKMLFTLLYTYVELSHEAWQERISRARGEAPNAEYDQEANSYLDEYDRYRYLIARMFPDLLPLEDTHNLLALADTRLSIEGQE